MQAWALVVDFLVGIGTLTLAVVAFAEISEGNRSRRLQEFDRDVERVHRLEGGDFLLVLRNMMRRWQEDPRLGTEVRRMQRNYEKQADQFGRRLPELRPSIIELAELMLREHPEVGDDGPLVSSQEISGPDYNRSMQWFGELAKGADPRDRWHYYTAYNYPPDRQAAEKEEPTPETWMLSILQYREEKLHGQEIEGVRAIDRRFRDGFRELSQQHDNLVKDFVYWKRTGPEGAVHELLLVARGLVNPNVRSEDNQDLVKLVKTLAELGFYRSMVSSIGEVSSTQYADLDKVKEDIHRLVERAAEGLRPTLERKPFDRITNGTFAR